jgi:Fur family transcriptional regulator, ferric uptake regulator
MPTQSKHHCGGQRAQLVELTERLRRTSRKVTGSRQAILALLRHQTRPLSNKEILTALPAGEADLATVYRSMHLLEEIGMVKAFDLGDGITRYELLSEGDDGHHHHLVCVRCAAVRRIEDCFTASWEQSLSQQTGFKQITHKLEFHGVCPDCQSEQKACL